jgi:hypothetical protein
MLLRSGLRTDDVHNLLRSGILKEAERRTVSLRLPCLWNLPYRIISGGIVLTRILSLAFKKDKKLWADAGYCTGCVSVWPYQKYIQCIRTGGLPLNPNPSSRPFNCGRKLVLMCGISVGSLQCKELATGHPSGHSRLIRNQYNNTYKIYQYGKSHRHSRRKPAQRIVFKENCRSHCTDGTGRLPVPDHLLRRTGGL